MSAAQLHAIGVDVGGTKIAAGCVTFPGATTRFRKVIPTQPRRGGLAVLEDVAHLVESIKAEAAAAGATVGALGLGLCELVSPDRRVLSANTVDWLDLPVHDRLSALAPFALEADVRSAALAEARFGAGRGLKVLLYVTVGTGIASCLVLDGRPYVGARGATGTVASSPQSSPCLQCGHTSLCLEELAAGPALVARFNRRSRRAVQTGREVLAAAAAGNAEALEVATTAGAALGAAVGQLVNVLDPDAVVVGGGLGLSEGAYWTSFCTATRRHIWSAVHRDLQILHAATGEDAGLIGAAATAMDLHGQARPD